ncbi:MAG: hypothetical protein ABSA91_10920 [Acidimicrobiales bacterium]
MSGCVCQAQSALSTGSPYTALSVTLATVGAMAGKALGLGDSLTRLAHPPV